MLLNPVTCTQNTLVSIRTMSWSRVQIILRRSKILNKQCVRNAYTPRFYHTSKRDNHILAKNVNSDSAYCNNKFTCLCGNRYMSDMKNDDIVKTWISEIKEDFEKEGKDSKQDAFTVIKEEPVEKLQENLVSEIINDNTIDEDKEKELGNIKAQDVNNSASYVDSSEIKLDIDEENLDIHGFTVDEMIELIKKAKSEGEIASKFSSEDANNIDEMERSSSDNEDDTDGYSSENEDDSDSSSSDDEDRSDSSSSLDNDDNFGEISKETSEESGKKLSDIGLHSNDLDIKTASDKLRGEMKHLLDRKNAGQARSIKDRFKNASESVKRDIEDFVNIDFSEPEEEVRQWEPPVPLTRGETGVFDIEELVKVLEANRARDLAVMKIPRELDFADYMIVVSAMSYRHMKAMTSEIKWIYKRKKNKKDYVIKIEGENTKDWYALDLGNIILHIFTPATRELYDLETLWTVGPKFDPKCQEEVKAEVFSLSDLPWLDELDQSDGSEAEPSTNETKSSGFKRKKKYEIQKI